MVDATNHRWLLAARPVGMVGEHNFRWEEAPVPEAVDGGIVVRALYLSVDPTNRGWMTDRPSYMPPVGIGDVMRGYGAGEVVQSRSPHFAPGDLVSGMIGWQRYVAADARGAAAFQPLPSGVPIPTALSLFNVTGMSAYFGLLELGRPRAGETVLVSGAAGAVGSVAAQIAKIHGCRVVGTAGSDAKCAWLAADLGLDAAINYRTEDVAARLRETCPTGIDVYFDNVGGPLLETVLDQIAVRARIVLCGGISEYNATERRPGPANLMNLVLRRARIEGFIITDYQSRFPQAAADLSRWMAEGSLVSREQIVDGLENAPRALRMLFEGGNTGKLLVKIGG